MAKIYIGVGLGATLCFAAVGAAELNDFSLPSAAACFSHHGLDFGPPAGCDDRSLPHNRTMQISAVTTGSTDIAKYVSVVYDAEGYQLDLNTGLYVETWKG